jgi:predicted acyl esterase
MRWALPVAALVLAGGLAGCLDAFKDTEDDGGRIRPADVGHDPSSIRVTDVEKASHAIPSFDNTSLAAVVYSPVTGDTLPDGSPPKWGVVVMLHAWGFFKEQFEGFGGATGAPVPAGSAEYTRNRLQEFARAGVVAVAYDSRGFGRSGGQATVAGPAELADLGAVLDYVAARYPTSGRVAVLGQSYGAGTALNAFAADPRVTTAVPMFGWVDLYHGILPGNVPKAQWAAELLALGAGGSKGQVDPMLYSWMQKAATRQGLESVRAEMDVRSVLGRLAATDKPLLVCQGMQETLFPQADLAWSTAAGFTRALVFQGGHGTDDETCWARALDWVRYFVVGHDTGVHGWPALSSVDARGGGFLDYVSFPEAAWQVSHLRAIDATLAEEPSNVTFTVSQRLAANPFQEPHAVWDGTGMPYNQVPESFRQDPSASFFETPPATGSEVLLGAPVLRLHLADNATPTPYQVVASLYVVTAGGNSQLLTRAAHAALSEADVEDGVLTLRFDWVKADIAPGETLVLKVGANDPTAFLPLPANYAVTFTGRSELALPYFIG